MKIKLLHVLFIPVLLLSSFSICLADGLKCTVDSVDGDKVTSTCDGADLLFPGDYLKVKIKYDSEKLYCTVDSVDGDKVTFTCVEADWLDPGDKIAVKVK